MRFNEENGFLFEPSNNYHFLSEQDINELIELSKEDEEWLEKVNWQIEHRAEPASGLNPILEEIAFGNISGVQRVMPYNQIILSFGSSRHFYRGENKKFSSSFPSLRREIGIYKSKNNTINSKNIELINSIETLKTYNFMQFIWNFDIVRHWYFNYSDINFKALAQHYGFKTNLLDLTNNFMVALFFATCKYDYKTNSYLPLTEEDINQTEESKYGVIFHSPNWVIDFFNGSNFIDKFEKEGNQIIPSEIDSGHFDGYAFQIGYQPLMRCKQQYGYIYPLRYGVSLQENTKFEKLYFKQTVEFSNRVYKMMDSGNKVFPYEGINLAKKYIDELQESYEFYIEDVKEVYETIVDKNIFPTFKDFKTSLLSEEFNNNKVKINNEEIQYHIEENIIKKVNDYYNNINVLSELNNRIYKKPEIAEIFKERVKGIV